MISIQLIVDTIGDALQTFDKKWVPVFDQINAFLVESSYWWGVTRSRSNYYGVNLFLQFDHPTTMSTSELLPAFGNHASATAADA